jgi:hypothetical protein
VKNAEIKNNEKITKNSLKNEKNIKKCKNKQKFSIFEEK